MNPLICSPEPDLEVEVATTREQFELASLAFEALMESTGAPAPARWAASDVWFRNHPGAGVLGVLVRRDGEVVAGAVLAHTLRAGIHQYATAGEPGEPSWLAAVDGRAAEALAHELAVRLVKPWSIQLHDLPMGHPAADALKRSLAICVCAPGVFVPRVYFAAGMSLNDCLSGNTRAALAKARNRIRAAGLCCEPVWTSDAADIDRSLGEVVEVHRRRDCQLRGTSRLDEPGVLALFVDTVRAQAGAGRVRLLTLRLDRALAAYAICIEAAGKLLVYANNASPDWLRYSPGTLVNAEVIRAAHADPAVACLDWGAGIQRYKLSGPVTVERLQNLSAWSSLGARIAWAGVRAGRRAKHAGLQLVERLRLAPLALFAGGIVITRLQQLPFGG